ncbi:MAG: tRNA pseudouridine(55) synthase TruB [Oscillospiraceae bacterium]|jgi:tRNA pseudouridine55 synthase|nr:tRNA pseudouridine(55) synthase TruB [Oscillospiraceae bacterium]
MPNGILIIDKPQDWTSMDVCAKLRGVFHEKRIGHGGTLDPMATGVLPVFIGRATRAVELAAESDKEYIAGIQLGVIADTQDAWGNVLERRPVPPDAGERLRALLPQFTGEIQQVPPMYSAVKINGKKLYELARKGQEVERKPRPVTIHTLDLSPSVGRGLAPAAPDSYCLRVRCSKGTYIRTLCHDLGQALGCGAVMSSLCRAMAGGFPLAQAHPLAEVLSHPDPASLLLPVDSLFSGYPSLHLKAPGEKKVRNGVPLSTPKLKEGTYRLYGESGDFLSLSQCKAGKLTTIKSFYEV